MGRGEFEALLRQKFSEEDVEKIMLAYRLAKYGHRNQTRDNGARYFEHVKGTALVLINEAGVSDRDTIVIALLHDIREESFILTSEDVEWIFGKEVNNAVSLLTKLNAVEKKVGITREEKEYINKLSEADKKTKIVKLADRLHNLRDMESWSPERKNKFVGETEEHILPWAKETNEKLAEEIKGACDRIMGAKRHKVLCQKWEESESGWGTRPDGYSLHLTDTDRRQYIKEYWDKMPKEVPDEYSRQDGTPYWVEVDQKTYEKIRASKNGVRSFGRNLPGSGGTDGWIPLKNGGCGKR